MQMPTLPDGPAILSNIFTDSRFRDLSRYRLFGNIDGVKIGVVLATRSPRYDNFALNKGDMDRLLAGKRDGKIDQAFVVMAKVNGVNAVTYCDCIEAEQLHEKLKGLRPAQSVAGDTLTTILPSRPRRSSGSGNTAR
jgi:hypothetical protein